MAITVGQKFVRRHNAQRTSTANTTAADIDYDTAVFAEGGYTWSTPEVTVDTAGKYLIIGDFGEVAFNSTRAVGTLIPVVNATGTEFPVGMATHRYLRNVTALQGASIGIGILDLAANDDVKIRNPAATLGNIDAVGNYGCNAGVGGGVQMVRLPDGDFLHLERTADAAEVGVSDLNTTRPWLVSSGSWTKLTWPTEVSDDGGWHAASSGDVTLPANSKFLIVWSTSFYTTDASRNCMVTRLSVDGTIRQTGTGFHRDTASQGCPMVGMYLHETGGSAETLFLEGTQESQGADAGTPQFADGALQIMKLGSTVEWIHVDNSTTDSLTTALANTATWYDTPLSSTFRTFTGGDLSLDAGNDAVQNDSGGTMSVLAIGWQRWDRDATGNTSRKNMWSTWDNAGTRIAYGYAGAYSRGTDGGTDDTWQAHFTSAALMDVADTADLTLQVREPSVSANSDMGIYASTSRHFLGVQVLDLGTLISVDVTATPATIEVAADLPAPTVTADALPTPATVDVPADVPAPTVTGTALASPATVDVPADVPAPSPTADALATTTTVDVPADVPAPTITAEAVPTPATIDVPPEVPAPTVTAFALATPATVDVPVDVPAPQAGVFVTATPATVDVPADVPAPTVTGTALASPATVDVPADVPAPSPTADALTATSATVDVAADVPAPTVTAAADPSPATIDLPVIIIVAVVAEGLAIPDPTLGRINGYAKGQFYRRTSGDNSPILFLIPVGRSVPVGMKVAETHEPVSNVFIYMEGTRDKVMSLMTVEWAADKGSSQAVLSAAINARLNTIGFKGPAGVSLV